MFQQGPIVISGDPIIITSALIIALGTFGLFILKVADKWYKFKTRRQKSKLERKAQRTADDLLS